MLLRKFQRDHARPFDEAAGAQPHPVVVALMPEDPSEEDLRDNWTPGSLPRRSRPRPAGAVGLSGGRRRHAARRHHVEP